MGEWRNGELDLPGRGGPVTSREQRYHRSVPPLPSTIDLLGHTCDTFIATATHVPRDEAVALYRRAFREPAVPESWMKMPEMPVARVHEGGTPRKVTG